MKNLWIAAGVFAVAVVVVVLAVISVRNGLIQRDEDVKAQWSQVETQLQRRSDLIPNLVNTVKGYAKHEEKIFTEIADARSRLLAAGTPEQRGRRMPPQECTRAPACRSGSVSELESE